MINNENFSHNKLSGTGTPLDSVAEANSPFTASEEESLRQLYSVKKFESMPGEASEFLGYPSQNVEAALKLFEKGLEDDEIIGYHGTSLETLQAVLKTGFIPGAVEVTGKYLQIATEPTGSLYFHPVKESFPGHELEDDFLTEGKSIETVKTYAKILAVAHRSLAELGLSDIADREMINQAKNLLPYDFDFEDAVEYFEGKGVAKARLLEVAEGNMKRRGVIFGLRKSILAAYQIKNGDEGEGDLFINVQKGLPLEHLAGIEPIGQEELDFLSSLQEAARRQKTNDI